MESTKANGIQDPTNEKFVIQDPRDKKSYLMRDASDEQLNSLLEGLREEQKLLQESLNEVFRRIANASAVVAVAQFELERRQRTIMIARAFS